MINYHLGNKKIINGQILILVIFGLLILINAFFLIFSKGGNMLIVFSLTLLLGVFFIILSSYIFQIHFYQKDILIYNLYRKKTYSVLEFYSVTSFLTFAGIYKLNLRNGVSYYFTLDSHTQAKNLFNIDSTRYSREITTAIHSTLRKKFPS